MQFFRQSKHLTPTETKYERQIPLQMYFFAPSGMMAIDSFEKLAINRVSVLKIIETAGIKFARGSPSYDDFIENEIQKLNFLPNLLLKNRTASTESIEKELYDDLVSHFILRIAYSPSEDLRRWFIKQELDLFRYRFIVKLNNQQVAEFLEANQLSYVPISEEEKSKILNCLVDSCPGLGYHAIAESSFYKVKYSDVLELVKVRKVYLQNGFAYVGNSDLVSVITSLYRSSLNRSLVICSRLLARILSNDVRLQPLLKNITGGLGDYEVQPLSNSGVITADSLNQLAATCFPLCMRQLHDALRREHHLKHQGRLMYWLFLKGIGLPLEENIRLFKQEFVQKGGMDENKFEREHGYNIRHSYGKEGKRTSYTPYSCVKIISNHPPGPGDQHGCPFKHTDTTVLLQKLRDSRVDDSALQNIHSLISGRHYQLACQRYFECSNKINNSLVGITHPNQYFDESFKLLHPELCNGNVNNTNALSELPSVSASLLEESQISEGT